MGTDAQGDPRAIAFRRLTATRLASFYRLSTVILGNRLEAEDATHDAAVRAWERWDSLRDPGRFDAWFQRILVNECRDRLRRRLRRPVSVPFPAEYATESVADDNDVAGERGALAQAVAELEPDQRIVVVLHFYLGLSAEQIAERTGTRAGTVRSRLHYALRALRAARDAAARIEGGQQ